MQGGTCGTENCDGRGLMYSAWPIRVGWVAGSGWMPIWLTNADQLRSAHAEPGSQSNQPQSARVTCGSSVKSVFWIWSLRPGCSKVSWDLWKGTIDVDLRISVAGPQGLINQFNVVNIRSGNGLVPSGTKPLYKPVLIKLFYGVSMGQSTVKVLPKYCQVILWCLHGPKG